MEYSEKEFYKLNEKFTIISIGELYRLINIENKSHYTLNNSSAFFVINLIEKRWANIPFLVRELVRTYAVTITEARDDLVAFLNEAIEFGVVDKQEFLDKEAISGTKMPIPQPPTISHEIDEKLSLLFKNFEDKIFKVEKKVDKVEDILVLKDTRIMEKLDGLYDLFPAKRDTSRDVFIVHGHDKLIKQTVARFLERIGLNPIILHEQPSAGNTIIEKLERYADVTFAIILLTPDDEGYPKGKPKDNKCRARQNVIMELGLLMGRLGREKVICLYKPEVELPSDILGVVFIPFDDSESWKMQLVRELKHAGIEINADKVF